MLGFLQVTACVNRRRWKIMFGLDVNAPILSKEIVLISDMLMRNVHFQKKSSLYQNQDQK
jgi:hypothetical protein